MEQEQTPHALQLHDRHQLTMSGISEVNSLDDTMVTVQTSMGTLLIQGRQLQLKNLSEEGGQIRVEGYIDALIYEENRKTDSWWRRLLG